MDVINLAIAFIRTLIIYCAIVFSMRIMGKRQLGELELSELVVAVLISNLAAQPLQDLGTPLLYGLIPVFTLLCCELIISMFVMKSLHFRAFICGKPSIIIDNGTIIQKEMKNNRLTLDELSMELRQKSITDISTVKYAILESDGTLSTILYPSENPVKAREMNVKPPDSGYPIMVICEGRVLSDNLNKIGLNMEWLNNELKNRNVLDSSKVYLMSVDGMKQIYFAAKEENL